MAQHTPLFDWHEGHGGRMVEFAGWDLPVYYPSGIINEHLACRKFGALFDISHLGRFLIKGSGALSLLLQVLTNDASRLKPGEAQYTFFSDDQGHPLDDAYLFQFKPREYLLVVNGANRVDDGKILTHFAGPEVSLQDLTFDLAMVAVQGPLSEAILRPLLNDGLPSVGWGRTSVALWQNMEMWVARTGYTGEPKGFELILPAAQALAFWEALVEAGAPLGMMACGLGARDTLRLEAGLPLYGHELLRERPILSLPLALQGVDLNSERGDFRGREALLAQMKDLTSDVPELVPRWIMAVAAEERAMIREGSTVMVQEREAGVMTSGTMVPAWKFADHGPGNETFTRAIGLAYLDRDLVPGQEVIINYRGRLIPGRVVEDFVQRVGIYLKALFL